MPVVCCDPQFRLRRVVFSLAAVSAYVLAFFPLYQLTGPGAAALATVPVVALAWLWGLRGGVIAGFLSFPLNTLLFNLVGLEGWDAIFRQGGGPGQVMAVLIGAGIGQLRDLGERLKVEITGAERTQEALQESEERKRTILQTAYDAFVAIDEDGLIKEWNAQAELTFGWTRSEAVGRPLTATIIPPRYREAHQRGIEHFLATGEGPVLGKRIEMSALHRNGRELPVELTIAPIRLGQTYLFSAFLHDISERKLLETVLSDSERRFRSIFESAPTGIVSVSISGVFRHTNPTFRALLGYTEQELKGMTFIDITHPDDVGESRGQFGELVHGKRDVLDVEKRYRRKDGSIVWAKTRAVSVRDERGELQNLLALVTDITELKRAEEVLHRAHDELEMEVQKRTKELTETNEALRKNEITLRRSQEELRALTAQLISVQEEESKHLARELHDAFSQRLAMLGMEVSALEQQLPSFPDSVGERLRLMGTEIGGLAKDVHQLSRRLHPSILDDLGLVVALKAECAAFSEQHGVPVEFLPKNVPESFPENVSLCLYRIGRESLRNIAKHAEAEEVHVTLAGTDNGIVLTIEDIGSGFDLPQIKGKGGLGLISMEERARLLKGSFLVRSQPGQGTKVEVNIPLNGGGG